MILLVLWCKFRHYDLGSKRQRRHAIFYGEGGRGVLDNSKIVIPLSNNILYIFYPLPSKWLKNTYISKLLGEISGKFCKNVRNFQS